MESLEKFIRYGASAVIERKNGELYVKKNRYEYFPTDTVISMEQAFEWMDKYPNVVITNLNVFPEKAQESNKIVVKHRDSQNVVFTLEKVTEDKYKVSWDFYNSLGVHEVGTTHYKAEWVENFIEQGIWVVQRKAR